MQLFYSTVHDFFWFEFSISAFPSSLDYFLIEFWKVLKVVNDFVDSAGMLYAELKAAMIMGYIT